MKKTKKKRPYKSLGVALYSSNLKNEDLEIALMTEFRRVSRIANTGIHLLYLNDFTPFEMGELLETNGDVSYPDKNSLNLYDEIKRMNTYKDSERTTVATMTHKIRRDYMQKRRGFYVNMNQKFPFYDFPFPIMVPSKDYEFVRQDDGALAVHMKLGRLGGKPRWVVLQLDMSPSYSYHRSGLIKAHSEGVKFGTLQLLLKSAKVGEKRFTVMRRDQNRNRKYYRVIVSIPIDSPPKVLIDLPAKPCIIHTDPVHFLAIRETASETEPIWRINEDRVVGQMMTFSADELAQAIVNYDKHIESLRQDSKCYKGEPHHQGIKAFISHKARKQNQRLRTWVHQMVAKALKYCVRNHFTEAYLCIDELSKIPHFPWYILRERLAFRLASEGIVCHEIERPDDGNWALAYRNLKTELTKQANKTKKDEQARTAIDLLAHKGQIHDNNNSSPPAKTG
jgi:hypothetical protein